MARKFRVSRFRNPVSQQRHRRKYSRAMQIPPRPLAPIQPPGSMRRFGKPEFRTWREEAGNSGVAIAGENCAAPSQARYCSTNSGRSQRAGYMDRARRSADRCGDETPPTREQLIGPAFARRPTQFGNKLCSPRTQLEQLLFCGKFLVRHAAFNRRASFSKRPDKSIRQPDGQHGVNRVCRTAASTLKG